MFNLRRGFILGSVFISALMLISCGVGLTKSDCGIIDWSQRGFDDANKPLEIKQFYAYQKVCPNADEAAYVVGYRSGQKQYCTKANGFTLGRKGSELKKVCPMESPFYKGFLAGITEYGEEREKRSAENITRASRGLSAGPSGGP